MYIPVSDKERTKKKYVIIRNVPGKSLRRHKWKIPRSGCITCNTERREVASVRHSKLSGPGLQKLGLGAMACWKHNACLPGSLRYFQVLMWMGGGARGKSLRFLCRELLSLGWLLTPQQLPNVTMVGASLWGTGGHCGPTFTQTYPLITPRFSVSTLPLPYLGNHLGC